MKDSEKLAKVFKNSFWHPIAHLSELRNSKDFVKVKILNKHFVLFNDNGNIIAFDNICPHRGSKFFNDVSGNKPIICSYHGWTFSNNKLKIPKKNGFSDCQIESADIKRYNISLCGDFVFVSINPLMSLKEQLGPFLFDYLKNISFELNRRLDFNHYKWSCDWPLAIENALEPYHVSKVHKNTLSLLKLKTESDSFYRQNSIWKAQVSSKRMNNNLKKIESYFDRKFFYNGYQSIFIFPFSFISSTYGYSYSLQNFFPAMDPNITNFNSRMYSTNHKDNKFVEFFLCSTISTNRQIFKEDEEVSCSVDSNAWNIEKLKFFHKDELRINHFREQLKYTLNLE